MANAGMGPLVAGVLVRAVLAGVWGDRRARFPSKLWLVAWALGWRLGVGERLVLRAGKGVCVLAREGRGDFVGRLVRGARWMAVWQSAWGI